MTQEPSEGKQSFLGNSDSLKTWIFNFGAQTGKSHLPAKIPCQDSAFGEEANDVTVIALSDGCGESDISQIGSNLIVHTICDFFINHFDEVASLDVVSFRRTILGVLFDSYKKYISENKTFFDKYIADHKDLYDSYLKRQDIIAFNFRDPDYFFRMNRLNGTLLFAATKGETILMGHIGDGYIGELKNGSFFIASEEMKIGEKNGTTYPSAFIKVYEDNPSAPFNMFWVGKSSTASNVDGVLLISDGDEGLIDSRTPFEKKFAGVNPLFKAIVSGKSGERSKNIDDYLSKILDFSTTRDDCSFSAMVRPTYQIREYIAKKEPRPVEEQEKPLPANIQKQPEEPLKTGKGTQDSSSNDIDEQKEAEEKDLIDFYGDKTLAESAEKFENDVLEYIRKEGPVSVQKVCEVLSLDKLIALRAINNLVFKKKAKIDSTNGMVSACKRVLIWKARK
jgi:hypothetical protein